MSRKRFFLGAVSVDRGRRDGRGRDDLGGGRPGAREQGRRSGISSERSDIVGDLGGDGRRRGFGARPG